MAWRFKASKYKNAAPIVPKPENCIRDLTVGSYQTYGHNIAASAAFMAFTVGQTGASLGVLPLEDAGRKGKDMALLHGHTDTVTDMSFSPFHDGLLATGSQDCLVKIWCIPEGGLESSLTDAECVLYSKTQRRVETVLFHPVADCLLTTSSYSVLNLWDITSQQCLYNNLNAHTEVIQCVAWNHVGTLLATTCKDKLLRIVDPRADAVVSSTNSHQGIKDSRVVWLNDNQRLLTTGFNSNRQREIVIRDSRKLNIAIKSLELDSSSGILLPLYDADTGMCFMAGKGDTSIQYMEVTDREPYLVEGLRHTGEQTKGACLVAKRALHVMQGEVNRVLQLTSSMVIPIMYQVPRKTYRDFHADLYPDTAGAVSDVCSSEWMAGVNGALKKISLDPAKNSPESLPRLGPKPFTPPRLGGFSEKSVIASSLDDTDLVKPLTGQNNELSNIADHTKDYEKDPLHIHNLNNVNMIENELEKPLKKVLNSDEVGYRNGDGRSPSESPQPATPKLGERKRSSEEESEASDVDGLERATPQRQSIAERRRMYENRSMSVQDDKTSPTPLRRKGSFKGKEEPIPEPIASTKRTSTVFGRVSKFRHLKGTPMHKSTHIENIRNVSRQVSGECDGFHANCERVAVPLSGPGGKIAVMELNRTGRLPDGVTPALVHGANVMDFCWDPFDTYRLAVSCDDGMVRLWDIPEGGLKEPSNEPSAQLECHTDKIYCIRYHPLARHILATAAYDMTVKIWDLDALALSYTLTGHDDQILCMAWSPCGQQLATVCKDGALRVYKPRRSCVPDRQGQGPAGTRGARLVWALDGANIVVTGFDKVSERQIIVYDSTRLQILNTIGLDVSPAILIPFYDEDSSTLFATGRGDTTIYTFEVSEEAPFVCPLSHHRCSTLHQGLAFLPKLVCDVPAVEFARALRLTNNTIEPLSFTVPRVKTDLFQDDLFPPTKVTWEATMTSQEWLSGQNKMPRRLNLKPAGMESLTALTTAIASEKEKNSRPQQPSLAAVQSAYSKNSPELLDYSKNKQEQLQKSVSSRLEVNLSLEQDRMEGVDESEWDE